MGRAISEETLRCSFCRKAQDVVGNLIASPGEHPRAYICDECVAVCNTILEEDHPERLAATQTKLARPVEIKAFLDQYVIGQEKTKKKLAVAVYNHYKRILLTRTRSDGELNKSNILLIRPTGHGQGLRRQNRARHP